MEHREEAVVEIHCQSSTGLGESPGGPGERAGWEVQCWAVLQGLKALSSSCSWAGLGSADLNKTLKCLELEPVLDLVLTKLGYVT